MFIIRPAMVEVFFSLEIAGSKFGNCLRMGLPLRYQMKTNPKNASNTVNTVPFYTG
jgi:hypothetical protein